MKIVKLILFVLFVVPFVCLMLFLLSGCVTQIPQDAGKDFYRNYNRAKSGVQILPPSSR